jgi:hypothetical protein
VGAASELLEHLRGRFGPLCRVGREQARDELGRPLRDVGPALARIGAQLRPALRPRGKRRRQELEQGDPEREQVGTRVPGRLVLEDLGGDEALRPLDLLLVALAPALLPREAGEAEIHDLRDAFRGDEDVLGLQIAVDEAAVDAMLQRLGHLPRDLEHFALGQRPAFAEEVERRDAGDELHRVPVRAVGLADVDDLDDVRVVELRRDPRLGDEPLRQDGVGRVLGPKDLDRDDAVEADLARPPD